VSSPDYISTNDTGAIDDFYKRMRHYEAMYETLDDTLDKDLSFIKIFNQGEKFLVNKVQGKFCWRVSHVTLNKGPLIGLMVLMWNTFVWWGICCCTVCHEIVILNTAITECGGLLT